jgi:uncharacterized protein with PQ loop repeat
MDEFNNYLIFTADIIGFAYNIPQVYHTMKTRRTQDISLIFLSLRELVSVMWVYYSIYYKMYFVLFSWIVTFISSTILLYYKLFVKETGHVKFKDEEIEMDLNIDLNNDSLILSPSKISINNLTEH